MDGMIELHNLRGQSRWVRSSTIGLLMPREQRRGPFWRRRTVRFTEVLNDSGHYILSATEAPGDILVQMQIAEGLAA